MLFQLTLRLFAWFFFLQYLFYDFPEMKHFIPYYVSALVVDTNS